MSFLGLLLASEAACRLLTRSGALYRLVDVSGSITTLPELDDRIRAASRRTPLVVGLGDSVLGPSVLAEHREPDARRRSLGHQLAEVVALKGYGFLDLSADGLLLPDLDRIAERLPPDGSRLLLLLNARMFASQFQAPDRASRELFLPLPPPSTEAGRSSRLYRGLAAGSALFRTTQLLRPLWFFPSQKGAIERLVESCLGPRGDEEVREAALEMKVAPFYRDSWAGAAQSFGALRALLRSSRSAPGRLTIILAPQNPGVVRAVGDAATVEANRRHLAAVLREEAAWTRYEDWLARYAPALFLDHCHLTAEGNRRLAADLGSLLPPA